MILGIGTDLVEVARIRRAFERHGDRFVARILKEGEIAYCLKHRDPAPFLAARFAAKEAISKAFGTGMGGALAWHDMEVVRLPSGQPTVVLHGGGETLLKQRGGRIVHLTLTHTDSHASATAILES